MSGGPERTGGLGAQECKEGCHQLLVNETGDPCYVYQVQQHLCAGYLSWNSRP